MPTPPVSDIREDAKKLGWVARDEPFDSEGVYAGSIEIENNVLLDKTYTLPDAFENREFVSPVQRSSHCDWSKRKTLAPPEDQRPLNACFAYALYAVIDAKVRIAGQPSHRLAPRYFHLHDLGLDPLVGTGMSACADRAKQPGFPNWVDGADTLKTLVECQTLPLPGRFPIAAVHSLQTAEEIKQEIDTKGPVICTIMTYLDFRTRYERGIYKPTNRLEPRRHAMAIVGYDDDQACWILKNSYGAGWGIDGGYCLYSMQASGLLAASPQAWAIDI